MFKRLAVAAALLVFAFVLGAEETSPVLYQIDLVPSGKLISRDLAIIDLRLPDRVTVRLSAAAAQARSDALKEKKPPAKKGGHA